jgi:hypothetical protein
MTAEETSLMVQSAKAEENKEQIIQAKLNVAANYLVLAHLLKENRDGSLFKLLHCDSFDEFLGMPEIGFSRSKAYSLIQIWELYKDKMGIDDHTLLDVGNSKLLMIAPLVEKDKEWLSKAKALSKSDLRLEINGVSGRESISPPSKSPVSGRNAPAPPSSCVNGCQGDVDRHHFPVGRVSSADERGDWTIPLCRKCHTEYHQEPKEWTWTYRKNWMRYLVNRGE